MVHRALRAGSDQTSGGEDATVAGLERGVEVDARGAHLLNEGATVRITASVEGNGE